MLKRINDIPADVPATVVAGLFLLLDLVPHLTEEFGGSAVSLNFLPFDPAWVTVIISGIPMVYLALWRVIHNPGISNISSALLIVIAMFAAIAIGDLFAAGEVAWSMVIGAMFWCGSNLTANTMQLTCSPDKNRPTYIAVFCCITAFAGATLGSLAGGGLLEFRNSRSMFTGTVDRYQVLFILSCVLRLGGVLLLAPRFEADSEFAPRDLVR